jgi:S1-C subfamily serine protease
MMTYRRVQAISAIIAAACLAMASPALAAPPKVLPQEGQSEVGLFGRQLVEKVRKGAIYIWIFGDSGGALTAQGIGSGFIFQALPDEDAAYALTNHHVAGDSAMLKVELWDNSTYKAQLVATEPGIDIALIKIFDIPRDAYEPNVMGDSDIVGPGDLALAIGAPGTGDSVLTDRSDPLKTFGLHQTTTMRVVTGRSTDPINYVSNWAGWRLQLGRQVLTNLPWSFATQCAINGGNSGGPLYNFKGEVIGLNHAGYPAGAGFTQNENYTIPINFAKKFAYDIINDGKHVIPWCGLDMLFPTNFLPMGSPTGNGIAQAVAEWEERHYDRKELKVYGVREGSPAEQAGFQLEDKILTFDGRTFDNVIDLRIYIFDLPLGKQVPVTVKRGSAKVELMLEIGNKRRYDSEFSF